MGPAAVEYLNQIDGVVRTLASQFKVKYEDLPGRVAGALLASFQLLWCGPHLGSTACPSSDCKRPESGSIARMPSDSAPLTS